MRDELSKRMLEAEQRVRGGREGESFALGDGGLGPPAISAREKWPWPTSTTSRPLNNGRTTESTSSTRTAMSPIDSPPGHGCVHTVQFGTVSWICVDVMPS